jgi:tetratricopeptide (TPR) repeat protein
LEPVLLGRDPPLRALRAGLEATIGGRGNVAVISGEAGIGKSVVAAAIARDAQACGATITWGRAWEFADAPPYFPVWPCLRALGIDLGGDDKKTYDEVDAFRLWEAVVTSLARATSDAPVVWILEDIHAADLGTLDLLTFLAQPLRAMRAFVIATVRTNDLRITDRMAQRLARLARDGLDIVLEPLSDPEIAALTSEIVGRRVAESTSQRLAELTGGNPLFVVECARALRAAGGAEGTLGSLPPTVRQVVLERVAALPEAARDALGAGAVLGRDFSAASVARMMQSLPARVIDALLPALRAGLVREAKPGQFSFGHVLTRDAIEDALGSERRAALHGRAEAALAALGDAADVLVERARHALAALRLGQDAHALALTQRATDLLEREGAFDRAFELHARIAEARQAGLLPPMTGRDTLHVAHVARTAGRSGEARRLCEEVASAARAAGDAELLAKAALLHAADVRPGVIDRRQVALLEEARMALGARAPELGCIVLARLATALQPAPDSDVPGAMAREAVRQARETKDESVILETLELASWGLYYAPLLERTALTTELLERALRAEDIPRALQAHAWLAFCHVEARQFDDFGRDVAGMLALSERVGHPRRRWPALLLGSAHAVLLGRFAESDRYVTEVAQLAPLIDDPAVGLSLVMHQILRGLLQRRDDEVRAAIAQLERVTHGMPSAPVFRAVVRASCWARMGDVDATRAELVSIGPHTATAEASLIAAAHLAEAYAIAGTDDDRRRLRATLARAEQTEIAGGLVSFTYDGPVVRLLGLLDAALGDLPLAERELREALALAIDRRHTPLVAQTAYELARVTQRAGRGEETRALLAQSSSIARELGMTGLAGRASERTSEIELVVELEREGDVWRVRKGSTVVRVKHSRGMGILARLVQRPGDEVHVLTLGSDEPSASVAENDAGEMLDPRARQSYRERLADLEQEIAEAERHGDVGKLPKLQRERAALAEELRRALGLGGRVRRSGSATERARVNVQRRVKDAIARITELDPGLGRFFESAVSTGTFCRFRP